MSKDIKRNIGLVSLLSTGLGSIIGSGWLFGAWKAAQTAGPAAILAWLIGALAILAIAFTYAELGAMFPESGGMVRYTRYSHGALAGFISAWANWISITSIIPIEAEASIQYMSSWPWQWANSLYLNGSLTATGLVLSAALVVFYFMLNYWGVKIFSRVNVATTVFKFIVPLLTAVALILASFHTRNFGAGHIGAFAPYGWSAVLTAVATSGVVLSFNGFQTPINLAGEARNPRRNVPIAVLGSVLLALLIYLLLQIAFIGAIDPADLGRGWAALDFSSPLAELTLALNLNWLVMLLYLDAFISPSGAGMTYTAATARMVYAMERNNTLPKLFGRIHPIYGVPRPAMWFNLAIAFFFMFFFRGWDSLAAVISVAMIISYLTGPVSLMTLRRTASELRCPLAIPGMPLIAPFAFVCASLILYWACWPLTGKVILLMIIALPVYLYYQTKAGWSNFYEELKSAWWLVVYLPTAAAISYIGSARFGGRDWLPFGWDMLAMLVLSLIFYYWGVYSGRRTVYIDECGSEVGHIGQQAFLGDERMRDTQRLEAV